LGPGGYPPTNAQGQRICRQCGLVGRYKDGKCVEKWGPGPEGPGTVCDKSVFIPRLVGPLRVQCYLLKRLLMRVLRVTIGVVRR
jgi:hypothetical protein